MSSIISTMEVYRRQKKLTQLELAQKIGIFQEEISRYEGLYVTPKRGVLKKIAEVLGFSSNYRDLLLPYSEYKQMKGDKFDG